MFSHKFDFQLGKLGWSITCECGYSSVPHIRFREKEEAQELANLHIKMIELDISEESDRKSGAW